MRRVKETGEIPPDHRSHDHLNEQKEIAVPDELRECWSAEFQRIKEEREAGENGKRIVWALVDGFLLYWHKVGALDMFDWRPSKVRVLDSGQDVIAELDVHIMLRVPHDVLKQRRHERHGYHTAGKVELCTARGSLVPLTNTLPSLTDFPPPEWTRIIRSRVLVCISWPV